MGRTPTPAGTAGMLAEFYHSREVLAPWLRRSRHRWDLAQHKEPLWFREVYRIRAGRLRRDMLVRACHICGSQQIVTGIVPTEGDPVCCPPERKIGLNNERDYFACGQDSRRIIARC